MIIQQLQPPVAPPTPLLLPQPQSQPQSQSQPQPLLPPPTPLLLPQPPQQKRRIRMIIQQLLPLLPPPIPQLDKFPMKISSKILITPYRMRSCLTVFLWEERKFVFLIIFEGIGFLLVIRDGVRYDRIEKIGGVPYETT